MNNKLEQLDEKGFIFLDQNDKPFLIRMNGDTPWIYRLHPDNNWVSLRATNQTEIWAAQEKRVSEELDTHYRVLTAFFPPDRKEKPKGELTDIAQRLAEKIRHSDYAGKEDLKEGPKANNRYLELEKKINQARLKDYSIVSTANGRVCPYELQRDDIVEKFFKGSWDDEDKKHLLNIFEQINEIIKAILGL